MVPAPAFPHPLPALPPSTPSHPPETQLSAPQGAPLPDSQTRPWQCQRRPSRAPPSLPRRLRRWLGGVGERGGARTAGAGGGVAVACLGLRPRKAPPAMPANTAVPHRGGGVIRVRGGVPHRPDVALRGLDSGGAGAVGAERAGPDPRQPAGLPQRQGQGGRGGPSRGGAGWGPGAASRLTGCPVSPAPPWQTRLGNQNPALAVQAVRTVRGNSFCIDCDAPSECRGAAGGAGVGGGREGPARGFIALLLA